MKFKNLRILIVSPEAWGINMLSKHHYAIELAARENQVFFLNPSKPNHKKVNLEKHPTISNILIINYTSFVKGLTKLPYWLSDTLAWFDIRRITKASGGNFDVIWNFDMYRFHNAKLFRANISILHPVDFTNTQLALRSANYYTLILSVSDAILEKFKAANKNAFFINHGVNKYILASQPIKPEALSKRITCGYVGNLLSFAIHYENLIQIVSSNKDVDFHFIGPHTNSNLGSYKSNDDFLTQLSSFPNVTLHGSLPPEKVATLIQEYDMFLICYHPEKVGEVVSNNHKVLEYLSTGKVVVSSETSTYDTLAPGLFEMVTDSTDLPQRFKLVASNLSAYNTEDLVKKRKAFARDNSYSNQIQRIENLITQLQNKS
jgi:glycosyltransferase involved in cell wall biosynthesis